MCPPQIVLSKPDDLTEEDRAALQDINEALEKARDGDPAQLNRIYERVPKLAQLIGDNLIRAEREILKWWGEAGSGPELYLAKMREDLGYDGSGGLERLLIDRMVVCWLRVQQAEHVKTNKDKDGITLQWATVWERRLAIAHRNFLLACNTLAQVRKLLKHTVTQVNIGGQQVNVANIEGMGTEAGPTSARHDELTD